MKSCERCAKLEEALCAIGNIAGGPTMSYEPEMERREALASRKRISQIVVVALSALPLEKEPPEECLTCRGSGIIVIDDHEAGGAQSMVCPDCVKKEKEPKV